MCRNIRTLHNFDPPATAEEAHDAALQYVRKISGSAKPSKANAEAFDRAVEAVTDATLQSALRARERRPAEGPRGRGRQGPRPQRPALRGLIRAGSRHEGAGLVIGGVQRGAWRLSGWRGSPSSGIGSHGAA